jgi:hypothetical protein
MFNMMNTIGGSGLGFSILWALHILSVIAFFTGVVLFVAYAIKTFKPAQLKQWAIWLVVIGSVVCLLTIATMGHPWAGMEYGGMMQNLGQ